MQDINDFLKGYTPPEGDGDFTVLPEGEYQAVIDSMPIKSGDTGSYVNVCFKIAGPKHVGRLVWDKCFLTHANPKANNVGRSKLYKMATMIGIDPGAAGADDYIGKKVNIELTIRDGKYNDVKRVSKHEASDPAPVAKVAAPSTPAVDGDEQGAW